MLDFFKNISINLRATGPAAVLIVWLICITLIGLFGSGPIASYVVGALIASGVLLIGALAQKIK